MVTIGWGKKETQFHGSEGKQAALSHLKKQGDTEIGGVKENNEPIETGIEISWRGDGSYFVVNYLHAG